MFFPQSLDTTSKEPKHWERFWGDQGLLGPAVAYVKQGSQEADSELLEKVKELASRPACRALGIVVGKVDCCSDIQVSSNRCRALVYLKPLIAARYDSELIGCVELNVSIGVPSMENLVCDC